MRGMRATGRMNQWLPLLLSLLGVAALLAWIFALDPRSFFLDDRQAQYFPYGLIIRDKLLHGEFPFLTTRTFYGSALWLDWQYGIYNPVSLLMDFLIMPQHLELSGLLFALAGNLLLAGGAYRLGRSYGLEPAWAALLGLLMGLNPYLVYYSSPSWHPGITSLAWLLFGWAALRELVAAERNIALHMLAVAVFMYLMVGAGWPHCNIAYILVAGLVFAEGWVMRGRRAALRLIPAGVLGAVLCLPIVVPVLLAFPWTARNTVPITPLMSPHVLDPLQVSNILWWPSLLAGKVSDDISAPLMFMAWFAFPILCLVNWKKARAPGAAGPAALGEIFFLLLGAGAGAALMLRYPIRWLPYLHVCGLLALLLLLQKNTLVITRTRLAYAFAALIFPALAALGFHPEQRGPALLAGFLPCFFLLGFGGLQLDEKPARLPAFLGASSLVLLALMFYAFPIRPHLTDWGKGPVASAAPETPTAGISYTVTAATQKIIPKAPDEESEFLIGGMGAYSHTDTLNGYSSLGQKGFEQLVHCAQHSFVLCIYHPAYLAQRDPETGASYLDLFKVDRIATEKGRLTDFMKAREPAGWTETPRKTTVLFERQKMSTLPGTLSWHSPTLQVSGPATLETNGEILRVKNGAKPGLLVFARLYYPGFRAQLESAPLTVRALNDTLVSVEIPPQASGSMELSFLPPGLMPCVAAALLALMICCVFAAREWRGGKR